MNTLKRFILEKQFNHYHKLAYKYFDKATTWDGDICLDVNERYMVKHKKYMNKRINVFHKLYPDI